MKKKIILALIFFTLNICTKIVDITSNEQLKTLIINTQSPLVLQLHAAWCPTCVTTLPLMHKIAQKEKFSHITFAFVDITKTTNATKLYKTNGIPTFIFQKGNTVIYKQVGVPKTQTFVEDMERNIEKYFE